MIALSDVNYHNLEFMAPLPETPLLKAMNIAHANHLLATGEVRLCTISYYREIEDDKIRDKYDGIGIVNCRGTPVHIQGLMETFVWCTSQAQLTPRDLARKFDRNAVLILKNPLEFARRLIAAAYQFGSQWGLQCRAVVYDKRSFRDRDPEDDEDDDSSDFYLFQKDSSFSDELEFRFALTDLTMLRYKKYFITLQLQPCADIAEVWQYQDRESQPAPAPYSSPEAGSESGEA